MSEKARTNHIRRVAARAGLRIASMSTEAGRLFAVIDGSTIVAVAVGFDQALRQLRIAAAGARPHHHQRKRTC